MSKEVAPVAAGIRIIIKTKREKPPAELQAAARDPNFELQKMNPKLWFQIFKLKEVWLRFISVMDLVGGLCYQKVDDTKDCDGPEASPVSIGDEASKQRKNPCSTRPIVHSGDGLFSALVEYCHQIGHKVQRNAKERRSLQQLSPYNNNKKQAKNNFVITCLMSTTTTYQLQ